MAKSVYDIIKKQNGEHFARTLRDSNLLDIENIAELVKYAGRDATPLVSYLWGLKQFEEKAGGTPGDPFELLHRAGYEFVEYADTKEKQDSIQKYFRPGETLCTFGTDRYQKYYIINAVKHNVGSIQPSDNPRRQDKYGTSVISIQIRKTGGFISIKNRYNHTVSHPDNTFDSEPDNIIMGLSAALKSYFDVDWLSVNVPAPGDFVRIGNRILKYDYEISGIYIGNGFYEKHGKLYDINKNFQIQLDYFILDLQSGKIIDITDSCDAFADAFNQAAAGKKITVSGKSPNQTIWIDGKKCVELNNSKIVSLCLPNLQTIEDSFLHRNEELVHLDLPNLQEIGNAFLLYNNKLSQLDLPNLQTVGRNFLYRNTVLSYLKAPKLQTVGDSFLYCNESLVHLDLPSLQTTGRALLAFNNALTNLFLPNLQTVTDDCLLYNNTLTYLDLPNLHTIGDGFLQNNNTLTQINLQNVQNIGDNFLLNNNVLTQLNLHNVRKVGYRFLGNNTVLNQLNLPELLTQVDDTFLANNTALKQLTLNKQFVLTKNFMRHNKKILLTLPVLGRVASSPASPVANAPITNLFPERIGKVQRIKTTMTSFSR